MKFTDTRRGISIVEVLVGVALFSIVVVFIANALGLFLANATVVRERSKATLLAMEGQEMVRHLRDQNWNEISSRTVGTDYHLAIAPDVIELNTTPEIVDGAYTRTITFENLYRNASDDIVAAGAPGATLDAGGRLVTVEVVWDGNTVALDTVLTNLFNQ